MPRAKPSQVLTPDLILPPGLIVPGKADDPWEDLTGLLIAMPPAMRDEYLEELPQLDRWLLTEALARAAGVGWAATPATMSVHLDPTFLPFQYSMFLGQKFADAVEGRSKRQIWNLPARYGKSMLASQRGPAWCLHRYPEARLILTSYGDSLALENADGLRQFLREHREVLGVELRQDRRALNRFRTTAGGGVLAKGLMSGIIGFGAGLHGGIVVDDPMKNWEEAHSEARRKKVWEEFRTVIYSRLDDDTAWIIVVMHRMHVHDLSGQLQEEAEAGTGDVYEVIALPEIAGANDLLGRAPGEPLEPRKFTLEQAKKKHIAVGSYLTAAMYQQAPSPEEGGEIKRAWFQFAEPEVWPRQYDDTCSSWDVKLKDKETGDFVVGQVWGRVGPELFIHAQLRGQWPQAWAANAIALMQVRYPWVSRHYVENTGYGPELMEELRKPDPTYNVSAEVRAALGMTVTEAKQVERLRRVGMQGLLPETPVGTKSVRMRAHVGVVEAGHVHLPVGQQWTGPFLDECAAFPNGDHDDQVDAMSQALKHMANAPASVKGATRTVRPSAPSAGAPAPVVPRTGGPTAGGVRGAARRRVGPRPPQ